MRYYSETGFDGIRNLLNGIKACVLPLPPSTGVVLLMTDRIFSARDVIKVHSLNVDAFEAPECGPVAYVAGEDVRLTHAAGRSPRERRPLIRAGGVEPRVGLVSCYTGMDGGVVEHFLRRGVAGIVVEGFGAGNVPPGVVPALEKAVGRGLPVVLTTRVPEGGVWPVYAYSGGAADLRGRGVILAGRLSAPKARVKLMVALGAGCTLPAIRRLFEKEI
jgi:L-asparaginase